MDGYINDEFNVVVLPEYMYCNQPTRNGYYIARKTANTTYIIDSGGRRILEINSPTVSHLTGDLFAFKSSAIYDERGYLIFNIHTSEVVDRNIGSIGHSGEGLFSVRFMDDARMYYLNKNGNLAIGEGYYRAFEFNEGMAVVVEYKEDKTGLYGVINSHGEYLVEPKFWRLGNVFSEGLCPALSSENETGYIMKNGEFAFKVPIAINNNIGVSGTSFEDGFALVQIDDSPIKWRIINKSGEYVTNDLQIDWSAGFSNKIALVSKMKNGEVYYGYLNQDGSFMYDIIFEEAETFVNGYARIILDGRDGVIEADGEIHWSDDFAK